MAAVAATLVYPYVVELSEPVAIDDEALYGDHAKPKSQVMSLPFEAAY